MNVLHVSRFDLLGRGYGGYDLMAGLNDRGIRGKQAVLQKLSSNPDVVALLCGPGDDDLQHRLRVVEERHSMNGLLFPWGRALASTPEFSWADVVHYHIIHDQMISLFDLPELFAAKSSIWTFHDPWPLTGHCVHPGACTGWLDGCVHCPSLDSLFPLKDDHAGRMWHIKRNVLAHVDVDIVVASDFMRDMVRRSPLTSHLDRVHTIPFGVEAGRFLPDRDKVASRSALGVPSEDFVIMFRASEWELKGLRYIVEALGMRAPEHPTTLLAVDKRGLVHSLSADYNIVELGWVEESMQRQAFSACDVFVMPSTSEAFGLMAVEAMAAGRPVVCFEGTALPSVTHAPECGVAVPLGDSAALRAAIDSLATSSDERERRGQLGRRIAAEQYGEDRYLDAMAALYESVCSPGL